MVQKSIDKEKSTSKRSYRSSTKEPPSWSELAERSNSDVAASTAIQSLGIFIFTIITPIGGLITSIFAVSIISSLIGFGNETSSAFSGAITAGIGSFFGSVLFSLLTLGIFTVIPNLIFGLLVGALGGYIGSKISNR
jgi:hypothetical protein